MMIHVLIQERIFPRQLSSMPTRAATSLNYNEQQNAGREEHFLGRGFICRRAFSVQVEPPQGDQGREMPEGGCLLQKRLRLV